MAQVVIFALCLIVCCFLDDNLEWSLCAQHGVRRTRLL